MQKVREQVCLCFCLLEKCSSTQQCFCGGLHALAVHYPRGWYGQEGRCLIPTGSSTTGVYMWYNWAYQAGEKQVTSSLPATHQATATLLEEAAMRLVSVPPRATADDIYSGRDFLSGPRRPGRQSSQTKALVAF